MAISGLVVTLADDTATLPALSKLAADPRLVLGEQFGSRLAVVAETPSADSDLLLWEDLRNTPGITNVDVTYVHLDGDAAENLDLSVMPEEDQRAHH